MSIKQVFYAADKVATLPYAIGTSVAGKIGAINCKILLGFGCRMLMEEIYNHERKLQGYLCRFKEYKIGYPSLDAFE